MNALKKQSTFIPVIEQHIILAAGWILFCVLHSVLASISFKNKVRKPLKNHYKYYRIYYVLFAFITLGLIFFYQIKLRSPLLYLPTFFTRAAGYCISITGLLIMLICIKKYFISLSGLKTLFTEQPSTTLMISGIHKYVRHPLYSGTFIFIWGLLVIIPYWSLLIADIIITAYTLYAIPLEEEKLIAEFGDDYKTYRQQVPKLIPSLKKQRA